jgi:hypothetical protein
VQPSGHHWIQLHDEVLTLVQGVARVDGDPGLVAATLYGVHVATRDELGLCRWRSVSDGLEVDERASSAILADPSDPRRWLVGTEAGVMVASSEGTSWERSDLYGTACRSLMRAGGRYWAGTDDRGIWSSADGLAWRRAGEMLETPVFSLAWTADDLLLAGTGEGVMGGDGSSSWRRTGARTWTASVGADPGEAGVWMAGGSLGGLWWTVDGGEAWHQVDGVNGSVETICAPVNGGE